MKRNIRMILILWTLIICMLFSGQFSFSAEAKDFTTGPNTWNNITWRFDQNTKTLYIEGKGDMPTSDYPWTYLLNNSGIASIKKNNYDSSDIPMVKNIVIGDGITSIGPKAFYDSISYELSGRTYYAIDDPIISKIVIGADVKKDWRKCF